MNRRFFLKGLPALPIAMAAVSGSAGSVMPTRKYGSMTLRRYRALYDNGEKLQVLLNGEDVTRKCVFADDIEGRVLVHKLHSNGKPFLDRKTMDVAKEMLFGHVEFRRI